MEYAKEFMVGQKVKVGNNLGIIKSGKKQGRGGTFVYVVDVYEGDGVKKRVLELEKIEWYVEQK